MPTATKVASKVGTNGSTPVVKKTPKKKEPKKVEQVLELVYPEIKAIECIGEHAITVPRMKELLGWENEADYKARTGLAAGYGEEYLLIDPLGQKIRCHNNTKNRPLNPTWCKALAQDILHSGPGLPEDQRRWQVNGESIIIGNYGQFLSGQHRGIGLILAAFEWATRKDFWEKIWPTEPVLETIVIVGISEEQRVIRTMDNVRPRTLADVFYTSSLFANLKESEKREAAKMMSAAVKFLWARTGVMTLEDTKYQTTSEAMAFFDKHPKLLECVNAIAKLNDGEKESDRLRELGGGLSLGTAAGALYLMATCSTESKEYVSGVYARTEKALNWDMWDKAIEFWTALAEGDASVEPVREKLNLINDYQFGAGGGLHEQLAVLAKAWGHYATDQEFTLGDIDLQYSQKDGRNVLNEFPTFGGEDYGIDFNGEEQISAEILQLRMEEEKKRSLAAMEKAAKSPKIPRGKEPNQETDPELVAKRQKMILRVKEEHGGKIVFYPTKAGFTFWANDASYVAKVLKWDVKQKDGMECLTITKAEFEEVLKKLLSVKAKCVRWEPDGVDYKVTDLKAGDVA